MGKMKKLWQLSTETDDSTIVAGILDLTPAEADYFFKEVTPEQIIRYVEAAYNAGKRVNQDKVKKIEGTEVYLSVSESNVLGDK